MSEFFGDLAMAHAVHITQHNNVAETFGEVVECSTQPHSDGAVLKCKLGIVRFAVIGQVDDRVDVIVPVALAATHKG